MLTPRDDPKTCHLLQILVDFKKNELVRGIDIFCCSGAVVGAMYAHVCTCLHSYMRMYMNPRKLVLRRLTWAFSARVGCCRSARRARGGGAAHPRGAVCAGDALLCARRAAQGIVQCVGSHVFSTLGMILPVGTTHVGHVR